MGTVFVENDENFLNIDNGDGYTTFWIYLMPLNFMLMNS